MGPDTAPTGVGKHRLRPFVEYAVEKGLLTREAVTRLTRLRNEIDDRLGQLAALKGYLRPRDVFAVMASQAEIDKPFGEIAVDRNLLSPEQVREILELQRDPFRFFVELIRVSGIVEEPLLRRHVREFLESSRAVAGAVEPTPPAPRGGERAEGLRSVLRQVKEAATIPEVVRRLLALLDTPDSRIEEVVTLIQSDPVISSQVLRLVNSAFFGLHNRITSVRHAVVTVGFRGIRQIVLFVKVLDVFEKAGKEKLRSVWRHSMLASQWAQALARERGADAEEALVGGLVHDLGRPVLFQHFPEAALKIDIHVRAGSSLDEAERKVLGCTHADVGAYLCHLWQFPIELHEAVLYHHSSVTFLRNVRDLPPLAGLVAASCALAEVPAGGDLESRVAALPGDFLEYHGLQRAPLLALAPRVREGADLLGRLIP